MLNKVLISENSPIKEVMRLIDHSGLRVAYIVDEANKLSGVVSDSEIRKAILKGKDIKQPVKDIVNPNPILLRKNELSDMVAVSERIGKLQQLMPDSRYILVLDNDDRPLKLSMFSELLKKDVENHSVTRSVLVVGGAGYLGSILVRKLLAKGYGVKVLDVLMFGIEPIEDLLENKKFELIKGDMRNISTLVRALADIDAVINLAAVVGDPACNKGPETTIETNYLANKALAEACKYHQINRFIYASTCSVYGQMDGDSELDENAPLNPVSLYARSKIQSEEGILSLEDENFSPTILRMSTLYGFSQRMRFDLVVNTMTKNAIIDKTISVHGGGKQWRPLLHVDDAAEAYIKCLEAPLGKIKGQIFNVGSSKQNYQIIQIGKTVKEHIPTADLIVEGETMDVRNYVVSFSKIESLLGFNVGMEIGRSVLRIKDAIINKEVDKLDDPKYYNVECY
ncbi:MAG: NAD-dependent epimerase/dehydratase family protein [Candidatus Margulisiibacteriota bacterium]|nr:NAD-dependent epimerase/dehydratase family protein [Candidatus Margulisiibacteriota bacterium]